MKTPITISDLSNKRQLELFMELRRLGVLDSDVRGLFPAEIQRAAEHLSGWPSLEELGIAQATITRYDNAYKAFSAAHEAGEVIMNPMLEWGLWDKIRYVEQDIMAERLKIVSDEISQIKKKLRKDKQNTVLLEDSKYRHLVKKFIVRYFDIYCGGEPAMTPDEPVMKKPPREKGEFPHLSKWSELTLDFKNLETIQVKLAGQTPVTKTLAAMGFAKEKQR